MTRYRFLAGVALVATGALAGLYDRPYAVVEAADASQVREEFTPAITQIDGKSIRDMRRSDPLEPGKHRVTVRFETGRVAQSAAETQRELEIQMEACTRYRIAARRSGATNWEPKVYSESIKECIRQFEKAG